MSNTMDNKESEVGVLERVVVKPPRMWNVILFNDDTTSMEFVVLILMQIFHKSLEDATDVMMNIHETGKGIAGTYSNEIASTKKDETIAVARSNGFPLQVEIEPVE